MCSAVSENRQARVGPSRDMRVPKNPRPTAPYRRADGPSTRMSSFECPVLLVSTRVIGREHGLGAVSWLFSSSTAFVSASSGRGERP